MSLICTLLIFSNFPYYLPPSAFSRRAVVSYWRKYVHEVLVNRLGGLSLPRKSVVRLTDRPDMTLDVYRGHKTTMQQIPLLFCLYTMIHFCVYILFKFFWHHGHSNCFPVLFTSFHYIHYKHSYHSCQKLQMFAQNNSY